MCGEKEREKKWLAGDREREAGNSSRSYLRFSFLFFFVKRNDRLKPGPSEHVHFFINCAGVNDPTKSCRPRMHLPRSRGESVEYE